MAFDFSNPFANVNTASPTPPITPTPVPKSNPPAPAADKKSSADLLAKPLKTDMGGDVISQFQKDYLAGEKAKADLLVKQAQNKEAAYQPLLAEREAGVVAMRFGLTDGQPKTLDEIGKVYGVTRERIRQIESKTMSKLRHPSRSQVLRDYLD